MRKKILLLVYGCEPGKGSEAGIGWHRAIGLARDHEVYVLTHPRGRETILKTMMAQPNPHLHFKFVTLPAALDPWRRFPGEQFIQARYILWQIAAFLVARRLVKRIDFDVVHHASWTTMTGPTLAWALGLPFVWGPVGSGQMAPLRMRRHLGVKGWIKEAIRNQQVRTVRWNPLAILAARKSRVALAANVDTYERLKQLGAQDVRMQTDSAVEDHWLAAQPREHGPVDKPVIAWASRMLPRKSPLMAVEIFAKVREQRPAELWMIGTGAMLEPARALARELGVEADVRFWGQVTHDEVRQLLSEADMFIYTSLRDTFPVPAIEAMARGVPTVTIDHHGARSLPAEALIKVPASDADQVVEDFAGALLRLADSPELRAEIGRRGWECVRDQNLWKHRAEAMREVYGSLLGREPARMPEENLLEYGRRTG